MRTEEELRDALASLERHAPNAARVLPGERGRGMLSRRRLRWPRGARWALAGAGAVAVVVTAVTVPLATPAHMPNGHVASPQATAPVALRAKLLAAFAAASSQIAYKRSTWQMPGTQPYVIEAWYSPWQAKPGQLVRSRRLILNPGGTPFQDVEDIYRMPAPRSPLPAGLPPATQKNLQSHRLAGVVAAMGEIIDVEYGTRTWSDQRDHPLLDGDGDTPAALALEVKTEHWDVIGKTDIVGHHAIELTWRESGTIDYLWVDANTYLPLRKVFTYQAGTPGHYVTGTVRTDYELLPATPTNLADLTPSIPHGFRRTTHQELPSDGPGVG